MPRLDFYHHSDYKLFIRIRLRGETLLIGRSSECDVQLPHKMVSRVHSMVCASPEGHSLEDRSSNGTRVNDRMVSESTPLKAGDRIYIESYIIIYQPDNAPVEDLGEVETAFKG